MGKNKDKNGNTFFTGTLNDLSGDIRIAIFKSTKKESDRHPDFYIVRSDEQKDKQNDDFAGEARDVFGEDKGDKEIELSDIPF